MAKKTIYIEDKFVYGNAPYAEEQEDSISRAAFGEADRILKEILRSGDAFSEKYVKGGRDEEDILFSTRLQMRGNNTLLFCGPRGAGKTTMLYHYLEQLQKNQNQELTEGHPLVILDTALPGNMLTKHAVRLVIARIMSQTGFLLEKRQTQDMSDRVEKKLTDLRADILSYTRKCLEGVTYLEKDERPDFANSLIQGAVDSGDSSVLKKNLYELIKHYLKFYDLIKRNKEEQESSSILVIVFDDADENGQQMAKLTDQIRTFLTLPNVVVMMAADEKDLFHFIKVDKENINSREPGKAAAFIMEKDYPVAHRVMLQGMQDEILDNWKQIRITFKAFDGKEHLLKDESMDVAQQVQWLLFEKTGIVMTPDMNERPLLLPKSLREMANLIGLLTGMESVFAGERETESRRSSNNWNVDLSILRHNVRILRRYFVNEWAPLYLDEEVCKTLWHMENTGFAWVERGIFKEKEWPVLAEKSDIEENNEFLVSMLWMIERGLLRDKRNMGWMTINWKAFLFYYTLTLHELYTFEDKREWLQKCIPSAHTISSNVRNDYTYDGFIVKDLKDIRIGTAYKKYLAGDTDRQTFAVWNYVLGILGENGPKSPLQRANLQVLLLNPVLWFRFREVYSRKMKDIKEESLYVVLNQIIDSLQSWKVDVNERQKKNFWGLFPDARLEKVHPDQKLYLAFLSGEDNREQYKYDLYAVLKGKLSEIWNNLKEAAKQKDDSSEKEGEISQAEKAASLPLLPPGILLNINLSTEDGIDRLDDNVLSNMAAAFVALKTCDEKKRELLSLEEEEKQRLRSLLSNSEYNMIENDIDNLPDHWCREQDKEGKKERSKNLVTLANKLSHIIAEVLIGKK